jgi:hypothetical protein
VIVIYYLLGLVTVAELGLGCFNGSHLLAQEQGPALKTANPRWWAGALTALLVSAFCGSLIPLAQTLNAPRYPIKPQAELVEQFTSLAGNRLGISVQDLQKFLAEKNAVILQGRSLYPRQFNKDEGLSISVYNFYHPLPYPRTLFTLIGPQGPQVLILPRVEPAKLAHAVDVIAVGCLSRRGYVQAWAVLRLDDQAYFERLPSAKSLTCPLSEPVCDDNNFCQ